MINSYLDLNFDVLHAATNNRYADTNDIKLIILGPIALFSNYKLTNSSRKHLEDIIQAHIVSLMYKLISIAKDTPDLSIGFDRNHNRRQRELSHNKNQKSRLHLRKYLKHFLALLNFNKKAFFGPSYKQTLTRNSDNSVLNKVDAINVDEIKLIVLKGMCRVILPVFHNKSYFLSKV